MRPMGVRITTAEPPIDARTARVLRLGHSSGPPKKVYGAIPDSLLLYQADGNTINRIIRRQFGVCHTVAKLFASFEGFHAVNRVDMDAWQAELEKIRPYDHTTHFDSAAPFLIVNAQGQGYLAKNVFDVLDVTSPTDPNTAAVHMSAYLNRNSVTLLRVGGLVTSPAMTQLFVDMYNE